LVGAVRKLLDFDEYKKIYRNFVANKKSYALHAARNNKGHKNETV